MPLVSYKNAVFLNNEVPGIQVPEHIVSQFALEMTREEAEERGKRIAVDIATRVRPYVDGFYHLVAIAFQPGSERLFAASRAEGSLAMSTKVLEKASRSACSAMACAIFSPSMDPERSTMKDHKNIQLEQKIL